MPYNVKLEIENLDNKITLCKEFVAKKVFSKKILNNFFLRFETTKLKGNFQYFCSVLVQARKKIALWLIDGVKNNVLLNSKFGQEYNKNKKSLLKNLKTLENQYWEKYFPRLINLYYLFLIEKRNLLFLENIKSTIKTVDFKQKRQTISLMLKTGKEKYFMYDKNFFGKIYLKNLTIRKIDNFIIEYDEKYKIARNIKAKNSDFAQLIIMIGIIVIAGIILLVVFG